MSTDLTGVLILAVSIVNFLGLVIVALRVEIRGARSDGYDRRIAVLEEQMRTAPSHGDLAAIRDRIAGLSGQMSALADRQGSAMDMIRSIQQHLLGSER